MERLSIIPRTDWKRQLESVGVTHHTLDNGDIYWDDSTCYRFNAQEIDEVEDATREIEKISMELVEHVIQEGRYSELNIP